MLSWLKGIICCPAGCSESAVRETTNLLFWQSQHVAREHPDHTKKVTGYNGHVASSWHRSDYPWIVVIIRAKHSGSGIQQRENPLSLSKPLSKQILSIASCSKPRLHW